MTNDDGRQISIVIVSWNTLELTRACLRSAYEAKGDLAAHIVVVDNASSDGSADMVAREFPGVHLIRNPDNRGFATATNQGIRAFSVPYVLLLNPDTVALGTVIEASVEYMEAHPDVGVMGCRVLNPDRTMQPTCSRFPSLLNLFLQTTGLDRLPWPPFLGRYLMKDWQRDDERDVDNVTGCYMLVRHEAMDQVGLLDETFFFCGEETDWCRRFQQAGWRVRFAPVGEIIHVGNASGRRFNYRRDLLLTAGLVRLHRKHGGWGAAATAWLLLWGFNTSRLVFWTLASPLGGRRARERCAHFAGVVRHYGEAWPRVSGAP